MADAVSKSGVWFDTKTGEVVESAPAEGVQLVPPGFEVTPDMQQQVDLARKVSSAPAGPVDQSVQESTPVKAVSTSTVNPTKG